MDDDTLTIDIDGWEGPLDLLLALARAQKVDLRQLSILDLVQQYLDFVEQATRLKLELAADYLVMAAWLALLKSALLLPREPEQEPSPEALALRQIGRAHVCTPVPNEHLVCRLLLEKTKKKY